MRTPHAIVPFFHARADAAEALDAAGHSIDAKVIATTALDALAETWFQDFPADGATVAASIATVGKTKVGGKVPAAVRIARFAAQFLPRDADARKVAVLHFAYDLERECQRLANVAKAMRSDRTPSMPQAQPYAHLDKPIDALATDYPQLQAEPAIRQAAEVYTYPAVAYRLYRCPLAHASQPSRDSHGFDVGEDVSYLQLRADFAPIRIALPVMLRWVRDGATAYESACAGHGITPGAALDPDAPNAKTLRSWWKRFV